jgi:hypothetical protein
MTPIVLICFERFHHLFGDGFQKKRIVCLFDEEKVSFSLLTFYVLSAWRIDLQALPILLRLFAENTEKFPNLLIDPELSEFARAVVLRKLQTPFLLLKICLGT